MKIKPCPFCGGKARLWVRKCDKTKYTIGCNNIECFLWIPKDVRLRELHNYATCFVEKKELIKVWNTRNINKTKKQLSVRGKPDVIELGNGDIKINPKWMGHVEKGMYFGDVRKLIKKIIKLFKKKG